MRPTRDLLRNVHAFLDCDIDSHVVGRQCFTKVGGPVSLIDMRLRGEGIDEVRWSNGEENYVGYVSGVTLNGKPATIDTPRRTVDIADKMLLWAYNSPKGEYNIGGLASGDDGWNPTGQPLLAEANRMPTTLEMKPVVGYDRRQKAYAVDYALSRETEPLDGVADASVDDVEILVFLGQPQLCVDDGLPLVSASR